MYMYRNGTYPEDNTTSDTKGRSTRKKCRLNQKKRRYRQKTVLMKTSSRDENNKHCKKTQAKKSSMKRFTHQKKSKKKDEIKQKKNKEKK